ncbi:growth/differentiation factor 10-like [Centropristis striata]|uniref:growth/differentiation factor 10-like n=1 Tax=Centropristis striata TaxID=184440 RepID=UPI0027DEF22A|nr:growth/differentiation factor 10-like [Centropristis striata]
MGLFPTSSSMASRLLHTLHLLLILESSWAKPGPEDPGEEVSPPVEPRVFTHESAKRDMVSINMFKVFDKYSKEPQRHKDGNTVRSFTALPRVLHGKEVFQFNLSSIQESELVLLASFHFLYKRPRHHQRPWRLRRPPHPSPTSSHLLFHGSSSSAETPLGNVTLAPFRKGSWQTRDVTAVVKHARDVGEFVVTVEFETGVRGPQRGPHGQENLSSENLPYILVYADDRAIDEPNSVATSLQRYGPFPGVEDASHSASRVRRELQIHTNDIPEVQYNTLKNHELWQNTYFPAEKAKAAVKAGRKHGPESGEGPGKPQVLSFDERTMKKARRRQWSEPRVCSRRYLRVDFADIGWSEWVLAPKSFDAYYCAGACGFPIPKVVRPSNHATIQSIVRAVGIVPGVPEPCCVPEKMSPLSVLFLDTNRNMVLKVYPGMSVDTCSCR